MKYRIFALFFCVLSMILFPGCAEQHNVSSLAEDGVYLRFTAPYAGDGLVINSQGQSLSTPEGRLVGDMPCWDIYYSALGSPGVKCCTFPSESFTFHLIAHDDFRHHVAIWAFSPVWFSYAASLPSGTATLYQDGSVELDGDLTEFEVRVQLPADQKHQWIINGTGAEQDHVEIYFKNGEPVVESINDDLTYTVEKEEYSH